MKTVLVAGASGLVGTALVSWLKQNSYTVHVLSTSKATDLQAYRFHWNPDQNRLDERCLENVEAVINLSGAGLFDHRWTKSYKKTILKSRTQSTELLVQAIQKYQDQVKVFINASATGYYGSDTGEAWVDESSVVGHDFLAQVVQQWEYSLLSHQELKTRKVCLRFGIVLSDHGGALPQLAMPVRYGVGALLGSGKQYISWIHIDDLCRLILFVLEHKKMEGIYNAVAPEPVTNAEMTIGIANALQKKLWAPPVPSVLLRVLLGSERAATLLGGNKVKNSSIETAGFDFTYKTLQEALHSFFSSGK